MTFPTSGSTDVRPTLFRARTVLPITAPPIEDGAVLVRAGRIEAVGPARELIEANPGVAVSDRPGVLTPGLINAHTHLNYTHAAHLFGNGKPFAEWIQGFPPIIASSTPQVWRDSAQAGIAAMLASGCTAAADVVTGAAALTAQRDAGLAGIGYYETVLVDQAGWAGRREAWLADLDEALDGAPTGAAAGVGISPHSAYTVDGAVLADLAGLARARGVRLHPHAAEQDDEVEFVATGTGLFAEWARDGDLALGLLDGGSGRTPVAEYAAHGLIGTDVHLAHGVHVDAVDRQRLREQGTPVALCPRSNARLACGEAPVAAYRAEGNPVGIGTDSLASSPSLDLLAEARAVFDLARAQGSPEPGLAEWIVRALTLGGAKCLGRNDIGRLEPGARADLAVFDVASGDPYRALVTEGAGTCRLTVVAGEVRT